MTERSAELSAVEIEYDVAALIRPGGLLDQLRDALMTPVKNSRTESGVRQKGFSSSPPWAGDAADVYFMILAGASEMEFAVRRFVTGRTPSGHWTRTHLGARQALKSIKELAPQLDDEYAAQIARRIAYWRRSAEYLPAIDTRTRQVRLGATCPFCAQQTLFVAYDASSDVVCRGEGCGDPDNDNQPYRWTRADWIDLLTRLNEGA